MPVFFVAPSGGLHEHVSSLVSAILGASWSCTVVCKKGPFSDRMESLGANVVRTDFSDIGSAAAKISNACRYDLVHAHPFASRELGLIVSEMQNIPLMLTMHGMYEDELQSHADKTSLILCVSDAVRDYLIRQPGIPSHKLFVARNGVDTGLFRNPTSSTAGRESERPLIALVTPLREDKGFICRVIKDAWRRRMMRRQPDWDWLVVGDGALRPDLEAAAQKYDRGVGRKAVRFEGWLPIERLPEIYHAADVAITPGRSALESMACGTPTIAVGSRGYIGFLDHRTTVKGIYTNFGGIGQQDDDYRSGRLESDIELALGFADSDSLSAYYDRTVGLLFDQKALSEQMIATYEWVSAARGSENLTGAR